MIKDSLPLSILIIEDNVGDFVLLEDYLHEKFEGIRIFHETTLDAAILKIESVNKIDVILLDLALPFIQGEALVEKIQQHTSDIPIIILTGYTDIELARKILSMGISDFLIKDEINPEILYKSIIYSLERKSYLGGLRRTKKTYQDLFNLSPQPMWIYDMSTLRFLDVNQAMILKYGYTLDEFKSMTLKDIRPKDQIKYLEDTILAQEFNESYGFAGVFLHTIKSGENIYVEVYSSNIEYNNKKARLALANDVTEKLDHIKKIETQNTKLKDIAWTQSHVVRAPLSRILGLINLIEMESFASEDLPFLLDQLKSSANEMDSIVQKIVSESKLLIINEKDYE